MLRILPLVIAIACSTGCSESPSSSRSELRPRDAVIVDVKAVGLDRSSETPVLLLEERGGERVLPIWIGAFEARSIQAQIESVEWPRPNTHDLAKRLLLGLDATVERVVVTELRGSTYYAVVRVIADRGGAREIDARPSDAIALALRFDAPVFVQTTLFDERAGRADEDSAEPSPEIRL